MVLVNQIAGFQIRHIFRRRKWWGHLHLKLVSVSCWIKDFVGDTTTLCLDIKQEFFIFHFSMFHVIVWISKPEILLNTYILMTSREQQHIWTSEQIFYCFTSCMGVNNTQNISTESKRKLAFTLCSPPHFKPFLIKVSGLILLMLLSFLLYFFFLHWIHK